MVGLVPFSTRRRVMIAKSLRNSKKGLPRIMAVVNCTPDSFHPESRKTSVNSAIEYSIQALKDGASWLDIGGESTRPNSLAIRIEEELARVIPVIEGIRRQNPEVMISIDTRNHEVASAALNAGADLINDVSGLRDKSMFDLVLESGCGVCIMHMLGTPDSMQNDPQYGDVVQEISADLNTTAERLVARGHPPELICLDAGIGFGKRLEHNLDLLRNSDNLRKKHDFSIMVGASRKSMFKDLLGRESSDERLAGTLGVAAHAMQTGVDILRVHDVVEHADLLNTLAALKGD